MNIYVYVYFSDGWLKWILEKKDFKFINSYFSTLPSHKSLFNMIRYYKLHPILFSTWLWFGWQIWSSHIHMSTIQIRIWYFCVDDDYRYYVWFVIVRINFADMLSIFSNFSRKMDIVRHFFCIYLPPNSSINYSPRLKRMKVKWCFFSRFTLQLNLLHSLWRS